MILISLMAFLLVASLVMVSLSIWLDRERLLYMGVALSMLATAVLVGIAIHGAFTTIRSAYVEMAAMRTERGR